MAGRDSSRGAVSYSPETAWAENVATFAVRLPTLDRVDVAGLKQSKIEPNRTVQLRNEGTLYIPGPMDSSSFKTRFYLTGHGSVTSGAMVATSLVTLLRYVLGYAPAAPAGTTAAAGWSVTGGTTAASATFPVGSVAWFGAKLDGRADGQPGLVASHVLTAMALIGALPAAPGAADVIHSSEMIHTSESPADAEQVITGLRFLLQTADQAFRCHGCWAKSLTVSGLGHGEVPVVEIEWGVSYFVESTATFPSALSVETFTPAVNGGGSMFLQVFGTTTRAVIDYRGLSLTFSLGVAPVKGPGGTYNEQLYVGARRIPDSIMVEFFDDAESATLTPARLVQWQAEQYFTMILALNLRPGKRMAIVCPKMCFAGDRPLQDTDSDLNVTRATFRAHANPAGATELERSAMRWAFA